MTNRTHLASALEDRIALIAPSRRLRLALADEILTSFAAGRGIRLLDAGAADGLLSLALAKRHPTWSVVGADQRGDLLRGAAARARGRGLTNARFVEADLTKPLPDSGFDAVMAIEVLSEVPDDVRALRMMAEALAPGGLFVVQVPERDWKPVLRSSELTWRDDVRHGYAAEEIVERLRGAGLEPVEVRPTYHSLVVLAQEVRDRIKHARLSVRAAAFPALAGTVRLERWGATIGKARALLVTARRPHQ